MATLALQIAGSALGAFTGLPFGAALGSAVGGTLGAMVDRAVLGGGRRVIEGPRLNDLHGISASEGAPIPRVYGRVKLGGQVIWATEFEEERLVEKRGGTGGKSTGGPAVRTVRYNYFANVAIGICEGPVNFVRRIWADGEELDLAGVNMRFYAGSEEQEPDPLIVAKQETGELPGFRGLAYVVLERFPLEKYGNRLPQFAFEVVRAAPGLPQALRAINIIPGSTEFGYAVKEVREQFALGSSQAVNRAQWTHESDWLASIDALQALAPNLERATLISSWFGDDLRAGHCTLRPKTEKGGKTLSGGTWQVSGLTRETALPVSEEDGRPNYGGTPADSSIIDAIRDLKDRGLKVALHPFILMDIPGGNALPDPWTGAGAQPPFPWRGRITCDPAPGRPSSAEGSGAGESQVLAFMGAAQAGHFSLNGDIVTYAGPVEWGYRRMVLHHAMLAKAAGGVDTFILGSEMIGLTHCAGVGGAFPFVNALTSLLADIRTILGPATVITYAADWTEYGARVRNGGQDVAFPLDPLWSHNEIGAIGIDFYPPLTDWRAGREHLDCQDFETGIDPAYLASRVTGGEAFDWFYADDDARAEQVRSAITDGAFGKPWIYRPKDIATWWASPHVERSGGVEAVQPTAFQPMGKPIYLTEIGCPAIDKGANQPNVFPDPKSVENAIPHFSSGARDDLAQWRVLEALVGWFDPAGEGFQNERNPLSPVYGGRMVDPAFIAPWAYDARPFPAFPLQRSLWTDGENWLRGHWLNGRIEGVPLDRLLAMIGEDFGQSVSPAPASSGFANGYIIDRPMSARAALEPLVGLFGLGVRPDENGLLIRNRPVRVAKRITSDALVPLREGQLVDITRQQEAELPRAFSLGFIDDEGQFRQAVALAASGSGLTRREASEAVSLHMPRGAAQRLAETRLQNLWNGRETFAFRLTRVDLDIEPGDLIEIETRIGVRQVLVTAITDGLHRECEGRAYDLHLAEPGTVIDELPPEPGIPALPGAAHAELLELPLAQPDKGLVAAAVRAEPWRGPYSILQTGQSDTGAAFAAEAAARFGETMTALPAGPLWRWDHHATLDVTLAEGALASLDEYAVLGGRNALALTDSAGETEIVLFREAVLVGARRYRLTGLLRGIGLSEAQATRSLPPGAQVLILDDTLVDLGVTPEGIGIEHMFRIEPAGRVLDDATAITRTITPRGNSLVPLSPVHARARRTGSGITFSFIRRTRSGGDSFDLYEVPLGEDREEYRFEILNAGSPLREYTLSTPSLLYPSATEIADFGTARSQIEVRIRQMSQIVGPGEALQAIVPVC